MSKRLKTKIVLLLAIIVVGMLCMGAAVSAMQTNISLESYSSEMSEDLSELPSLLDEAEAEAKDNTETYDAFYQSKAESVAFMASNNAGYAATNGKMAELADLMNLTNLMVVGKDGKVQAKAQDTKANFTDKQFKALFTTFSSGKASDAVATEGLRYYSFKLDDKTMVVVEQDSTELTELIAESGSLESVLKNITIGAHGYVAAVSAKDNTITWHPNSDYIGRNVFEHGFTQEDLQDGSTGWKSLNGSVKYCQVKQIDDTYYIAMVPESDVDSARGVTTAVVLFAFAMVMALVVAYGVFVLHDEERRLKRARTDAKAQGIDEAKLLSKKGLVISFIGFIAVVAIAFYMQTLFAYSAQQVNNTERADEVSATIARMNDEADSLQQQYNRRYLNKCQVLAYILDANPKLANKEDMQKLADVLQVQYTYTFDANGNLASTNSSFTNYTLSDNPDDYSYEFRSLLQGVDYVVQDARTDEISGELRQFIGVTLHDSEGNASGFAQIGIRPTRLSDLMDNLTIDHVLDGVKLGADGFAFSVSKDDGTFTYFPSEDLVGKKATDYGIAEAQLKSGFNDFITVNGETYLASSVEGEHNYIYVCSHGGELMDARTPLTGVTAGVALVCLVLIYLVIVWGRKDAAAAVAGDAGSPEGGSSEGNERIIDVQTPDGRTIRTESVATRFLNRQLDWDKLTPEEKVTAIAKAFIAVFVVVACVAVVFRDSLFEKNSLFSYIAGGEWERGLNIFAFTASLMFACVAMTFAVVAKKLLGVAAEALDSRGETICRMAGSFIKYATIIGMVYYCLALLGVDTTTLLASAGILSIAISLGAKEMVSDILSGLFIIFEGDFRVGDVIQVGDWRGTVVEIGVRTTKVMNGAQNIKVIRNSNVADIINMTKQVSTTWIDVGIEYSESLERVETILSRELPKFKDEISDIIDGPYYKGVVSLADSSVVIRILVTCPETARAQVERDLNREIKLLFDEYDVGIPYPQIVVNQPVEHADATAYERFLADKFNKEQRESSKGTSDDK